MARVLRIFLVRTGRSRHSGRSRFTSRSQSKTPTTPLFIRTKSRRRPIERLKSHGGGWDTPQSAAIRGLRVLLLVVYTGLYKSTLSQISAHL